MFEPWIGEDYESSRLLLLGESVYRWRENEGWHEPDSKHSISSVRDTINDFKGASKFFKLISRALAGSHEPSSDQVRAGWSRVAFTNFVGDLVGDGPRTRPTKDMWERTRSGFPDLIASLPISPKYIVVLGVELWSEMPPTVLEATEALQAYRFDDELCWCLAVRHPSRGLGWEHLNAVLRFLGSVEGN